jgi:outer membrane immunogenic protein
VLQMRDLGVELSDRWFCAAQWKWRRSTGEQMKKLAFMIGALLALAAPALAEDPQTNTLVPGPLVAQMPPPPMGYDWSGLYLGAQLGAAIGDGRGTLMPSGCFVTSVTCGGGAPLNPLRSDRLQFKKGMFSGGLDAGYNWQWNQLVLGFETDINGNGSQTEVLNRPVMAPLVGSFLHTVTNNLDFLGTVRGRLGWAPRPDWLFFGTGGLAYGHVASSTTVSFTSTTDTYGGQTSGWRTGWTAGGGAEYRINQAFSLKAEYLYVDLGRTSYNDACQVPTVCGSPPQVPPGASYHTSLETAEHIIRVGLNYHFGAPPPPPPEMPPAPPPPPQRISFIVFFDWDKDLITHEGMDVVRKAADAYRSGGMVQIQVTGYTDRSGSAGYNQRLSERRANNVAKALAGLGVPPNQMAVSGRGENDNRVPTADGVREPQNRRVEIGWP